MAKKIVLQAGHENCQYNSIVALHGSTGAPNEMSFNVDIRNQVAGELRKRGFEVVTTDANANDDRNITGKDWDLFLALHYDADVYGKGGGFVAIPDPSVDAATVESKRIADNLTAEYFLVTQIVNHPERQNSNTKYYYMWKYLTAKTPCVLIECGVGMHVPDDHSVLHFDRLRVVEGITRGVCKAFNVPYQLPEPTLRPPPPTDPCRAEKDKVTELETKIGRAKDILYGRDWWWTKVSKLQALWPR